MAENGVKNISEETLKKILDLHALLEGFIREQRQENEKRGVYEDFNKHAIGEINTNLNLLKERQPRSRAAPTTPTVDPTMASPKMYFRAHWAIKDSAILQLFSAEDLARLEEQGAKPYRLKFPKADENSIRNSESTWLWDNVVTKDKAMMSTIEGLFKSPKK